MVAAAAASRAKESGRQRRANQNARPSRYHPHLGHLVGLERVRRVQLLAARLLADLPVDLGHLARRAAAPHKADGRVARLDLARDV